MNIDFEKTLLRVLGGFIGAITGGLIGATAIGFIANNVGLPLRGCIHMPFLPLITSPFSNTLSYKGSIVLHWTITLNFSHTL